MTDEAQQDAALEALFDQARATPPEVPGDLMARVLADAAAEQPVPAGKFWRGWFAAIGGAPALGGLVTATCVGFWLGVAPPAGLPDIASVWLEVETVDAPASVSAFGWDLAEMEG